VDIYNNVIRDSSVGIMLKDGECDKEQYKGNASMSDIRIFYNSIINANAVGIESIRGIEVDSRTLGNDNPETPEIESTTYDNIIANNLISNVGIDSTDGLRHYVLISDCADNIWEDFLFVDYNGELYGETESGFDFDNNQCSYKKFINHTRVSYSPAHDVHSPDPGCFYGPYYGPYLIYGDAEVIDAGDYQYVPTDVGDKEGNPRDETAPDIGADEWDTGQPDWCP